MTQYKAAAYLRLSYITVRGEKTGQAREPGYQESDSIGNQRKLIEDFVANQPDIELVSEQMDDGYSGILFDRPAFLAMMDDVKAGKINCNMLRPAVTCAGYFRPMASASSPSTIISIQRMSRAGTSS